MSSGEFIDFNDFSGIPKQRFETCVFRSKNEETRVTCCINNPEKGYLCERRMIFKVVPEICFTCQLYKKK